MGQVYGMNYLREKLAQKQTRIDLRYSYYEMKNRVRDFEISTPPDLREWQSCLGWCAKAVDSLSDRLQFRTFEQDTFNISGIYRLNHSDVLFDSAILSALISSCAFIYISADEEGFPRLQVLDGSNATGILDPITGMLTEGYAVLERNALGTPTLEAYFAPGHTWFYSGKDKAQHVTNRAPYPLLVPIIYRPDARRPFGHSRISRACMAIVGSALRTIKRAEISAEFYSYPQKYVLGMDREAEAMDKWKATMSSMFRVDKDDQGQHPVVGQFQQASMTPHADQLRMFAALFAGETGLTLDDLGFATENPSSAEAIKAAHENLRLTARKAQRTFGTGFLNAGYLAACVRDDFPYLRRQLYKTIPKWEPIFEPDAAMLSGIGDGAIKINQAIPGYFGNENLRDLTGVAPNG